MPRLTSSLCSNDLTHNYNYEVPENEKKKKDVFKVAEHSRIKCLEWNLRSSVKPHLKCPRQMKMDMNLDYTARIRER